MFCKFSHRFINIWNSFGRSLSLSIYILNFFSARNLKLLKVSMIRSVAIGPHIIGFSFIGCYLKLKKAHQTQVVWSAYASTDWSILLAYFQGEFLKLSPLESVKCKCPAKHLAEKLKNDNSYQLIKLYVLTKLLWMTFLFSMPIFSVLWYYSLCILLRAGGNPHDKNG